MSALSAVVLAGGRASRLGGVDKGGLVVGDRTLLAGVLDAVATAGVPAARSVVVGPEAEVPAGVLRTREDPPFGGPLAALGAGLALLDGDGDVLVLACDLPRAAALVALLDGGVPDGCDGVVVRDGDGRDQWLAARYRLGALREAVDAVAHREPGGLTGLPVRAALRSLTLGTVTDPTGATRDVDTPADLRAARAAATMDPDVPDPADQTEDPR
ncbi:molybdenum cofactor guanylyltransferase [Serinibacter arcticus]|uniref:molybdenum cofactor guanylyltransferase n=1 Tax=Serinibacter arcticus TaxID=1655435 RepID=UPI001F2F1844|nr:nucleotidyltransferase family protein [Serinibacter arcticus]